MRTAFRAGLGDVRRVWGRALLLLFQSLLILVLLTVAGTEALRSQQDIAAATTLARSGASYFVAAGGSDNPAITPRAQEHLAALLDGDARAYSLLKTGDPETGRKVLVLYGSPPPGLLPDQARASHPVVAAGPRAGVRIGDAVSVLDRRLDVTSELPGGLGILDPWMGFDSLDDAVVVVTPLRALSPPPADGTWSEIIARVLLPDADLSAVDHVVWARSVGISLIPRSFADKHQGAYTGELLGKLLFVSAFTAAVASALVGIIAVLTTMLRARRRDIAIHRVVGAGTSAVVARLTVFVGLVWLVPTFAAMVAGSLLLGASPLMVTGLTTGAIAIAALLVATTTHRTLRDDPVAALREETT